MPTMASQCSPAALPSECFANAFAFGGKRLPLQLGKSWPLAQDGARDGLQDPREVADLTTLDDGSGDGSGRFLLTAGCAYLSCLRGSRSSDILLSSALAHRPH